MFIACQNLEKANDTIPRKHPDRGKDVQKDGKMDRPYFHRTLLATAGGPTSVK